MNSSGEPSETHSPFSKPLCYFNAQQIIVLVSCVSFFLRSTLRFERILVLQYKYFHWLKKFGFSVT